MGSTLGVVWSEVVLARTATLLISSTALRGRFAQVIRALLLRRLVPFAVATHGRRVGDDDQRSVGGQ